MIDEYFWPAIGLLLLAFIFYKVAAFGEDLGKCLAQSQMQKTQKCRDLERRISELERAK